MIRRSLLHARRCLGWSIKPNPLIGGGNRLFRGFGEGELGSGGVEWGENGREELKSDRKGWDERGREDRLVQEVRRVADGLEMNDNNRLKNLNSPQWEKTVETLRDNLIDYDELSKNSLTRFAIDSTVT